METQELERIDKMLKASGLAGKVFRIEDNSSDWTIAEVSGYIVGSGDNREIAWLYANAPQAIDELLTEVNRLRNVSQAYMVLNGDFDN